MIFAPGAFLQTDMPEGEDVFIKLEGTMAELFCRLDPKAHKPCLVGPPGEQTLCHRANEAIHGTLWAAIPFWENLARKLKEWGFTGNAHNRCTMSKMLGPHQCTVQLHADDLKVSCVDGKAVDEVL